MADRVQYILDRISPTLRRLEELKLFTPVSRCSFTPAVIKTETIRQRHLIDIMHTNYIPDLTS